MNIQKAYTGEELVETYDYRHFGGSGGQYIFQKDCTALESLSEPPRGLILDIPCGTGVYSERFKDRGYEVVAADASLPMLGKTGERKGGIPRVLCDIHHLPFRECVFDAVMTIRLFQHYPKDDVTRILHELRRAIKPGGRVIFDTFRWTPRRMPLFRRFLKGEMYVLSHRDVEEIIQAVTLRKVQEVSLYLFSPIWQRKLPLWVLWGLNGLEKITPQRWLLRTFWACTKD